MSYTYKRSPKQVGDLVFPGAIFDVNYCDFYDSRFWESQGFVRCTAENTKKGQYVTMQRSDGTFRWAIVSDYLGVGLDRLGRETNDYYEFLVNSSGDYKTGFLGVHWTI